MKFKSIGLGIVLLVLILVGGIFLWHGRQQITPQETLVSYFDFLVIEDYESAVEIFYPLDGNGDYDWSMVTQYRHTKTKSSTKAEELANYCEAVGTCLKVEVLSSEQTGDDLYKFTVQFINSDDSILLYGPFGGMTEEEMQPETKFQYYVKKIDNVYKVITPPLYRP
ncbi:MAG: hypothetical protein UU40_C0015G0022 [Candidatus Uhrbacteria bacterium GW2011_GWD2_41_121]|uniref:Uncharacterized protein n=1 Tax=Candidatus Uhrbacteria bacterium GW2011_GWC1_41_20 TaxID=1618983 RepID=A0A0G0VFM1_9BACT|nr:MAG: hypothetical protein UT52_C0015G0020 [Candidatus Uhrbacteria bacterium GW2011_GWE1_39_46]KKR63701.1 MAG: hypothetical protein UU04_C0014G0005 [Candidatus Uhrbacteria bacterium GW2011_GWC2_40_450]KKR89797.1 MAG: hypothetical protein UU40_C0015G0022 [Candidatus Uhrbacteria bacterium GW2011_GWD2_41_121]KKR95667.1 MAG: hypothetical protein UU46_C0017G0020 [Candidatus Uhrbacteria bacterium GW2011_GWD1_41_16]KKR98446.1 MAG: hypothetical protein UU50_C0017G0005 [Candidatus Uhrbacteria bacteriu